MPKQWLLKTEPGTYSISDLARDGETNWNGIRNFQARNYVKEMKPGDKLLIYHSGENPAVVGLAQVTGVPFPEIDPNRAGEWFQVKIKMDRSLPRPISLKEIKAHPKLSELLLIKQSRLSVLPVTETEYSILAGQN